MKIRFIKGAIFEISLIGKTAITEKTVKDTTLEKQQERSLLFILQTM
ncbi:hypothetical protein RV06_GL002671 [Enterococcus haemoperoxidus]|nr:hypothetical protein RV06_GL002671 [Enterococcus haemoperoxidus]